MSPLVTPSCMVPSSMLLKRMRWKSFPIVTQSFWENSIGIPSYPGAFPLAIEETPIDHSFSIMSLASTSFISHVKVGGRPSSTSFTAPSDISLYLYKVSYKSKHIVSKSSFFVKLLPWLSLSSEMIAYVFLCLIDLKNFPKHLSPTLCHLTLAFIVAPLGFLVSFHLRCS